MRVVASRMKGANLIFHEQIKAKPSQGLIVHVNFEKSDSLIDIERLSKEVVNWKIFRDENGVEKYSVKDIDGDILLTDLISEIQPSKSIRSNTHVIIYHGAEDFTRPFSRRVNMLWEKSMY